MNFFKKVKSSIYSPEFYSTIPKSKFGSAMGYFLLITLILAIIQTLFAAPGLLINLPRDAKNILSDVVNKYPSNLEFNLKAGQISTNVKEPYFIADDKGEKIAVIDTKTSSSASQFESYGTSVWLTKDSIFYKDTSQGGIKTQPLTQLPDGTLN